LCRATANHASKRSPDERSGAQPRRCDAVEHGKTGSVPITTMNLERRPKQMNNMNLNVNNNLNNTVYVNNNLNNTVNVNNNLNNLNNNAN
jgi:hypothetical protein